MKAQPKPEPAGDPLPVSSATTDTALMQAIAAGSELAFEELRRRYAGAVSAVCRSVAGSDREDCEQEVFARVWRKAALSDPERGSVAAWLLTVTRRTAINARPDRQPSLSDERAPEAAARPPEIDSFWLDAALAPLGERERRVIELAYYDDLSESAIAGRLQVPLGSVKSWKRRGLNRLASLLSEELE
jgi:RNA polymerase sigma-70 factor (ECF subfamily)